MERFPRKISRIEPLNLVGTARCAVRAAFSGATMPPAASRAGTSQRDVPTKVSGQRDGVRASVVSHRRAPPKHGFALAEGLVRSRLFAGHRLETGGGEAAGDELAHDGDPALLEKRDGLDRVLA